LPELLQRLRAVLDGLPGGPHEMVFVDDGSTDRTYELLEAASQRDSRIVALSLGMPIEATINMPAEITGGKAAMTWCRARRVHARPDAYSDGRMGFGAEIESYLDAVSFAPAPVPKSTVEGPKP